MRSFGDGKKANREQKPSKRTSTPIPDSDTGKLRVPFENGVAETRVEIEHSRWISRIGFCTRFLTIRLRGWIVARPELRFCDLREFTFPVSRRTSRDALFCLFISQIRYTWKLIGVQTESKVDFYGISLYNSSRVVYLNCGIVFITKSSSSSTRHFLELRTRM